MEEFIVSNDERKLIFRELCMHKRLPFSRIQHATRLRSNKLSYQLKLMVERGFLTKRDGVYELSLEAQRLVPFFSQIFKKEVGALPVVLGIVRHGSKVALLKRKKMPYKGYWGFLGGKQVNGESIPEAIEREVFEESRLRARFEHYNGIVCERLHENERCKHTFLFVIATLAAESDKVYEMEEGEVRWFEMDDVLAGKVADMNPADLEMLQRYACKRADVGHLIVDEKDDRVTLRSAS